MAYITAQEVKVIRENLKKEFPKVKFSIRTEHHISISVTLLSAPFEFVKGGTDVQLNQYHYDKYENQDLFKKMLDIINAKNHDNSDIMTDYCDVGYFVHLSQGSWDKPFKLVA